MTKTNALLAEVKEILVKYCPRSYFWRTLSGYPKIEYELKNLDVDFADKYLLTINLYDKDTLETIEAIADILDDEIGRATYEAENFYFKFTKNNDRQIINENDTRIARLMMSYEIILYWRKKINE